jgi:hypothetical protein
VSRILKVIAESCIYADLANALKLFLTEIKHLKIYREGNEGIVRIPKFLNKGLHDFLFGEKHLDST